MNFSNALKFFFVWLCVLPSTLHVKCLLASILSDFRSFFLLTLVWCSSPFIVILCFKWYSWSLLMHLLIDDPAGARNLLLDFEDYEILGHSDIHTCFGPSIQMFFRHKWRKLDTDFLSFPLLVSVAASFIGMRFLMCGSEFSLKFSLYIFTETFPIRFQKRFDHQRIHFVFFLLEKIPFCRYHLCIGSILHEWLKCDSLLEISNLFDE